MNSKDDRSPPERDRTANRRWMIGIVVSLVFGLFGAVMAVLSYLDRDRKTTIHRTTTSPPAAPTAAPGASAPAAPGGAPAPAEDDKAKGHDKK
jgi:hypothetical protein